MTRSIFLASPISGFSSQDEYYSFRKEALSLIAFLRDKGYAVYSKIEGIVSSNNYDSPAKSVNEDFKAIKKNDIFMLLHPARMQTSSLVEFGYACAFNKKILVVAKKLDLPFLIIGYAEDNDSARIVNTSIKDKNSYTLIIKALDELSRGLKS